MEGHHAGGRIDGHRGDLFRSFLGHGFDIHAAFGGGDDHDARGLAVDQQAQIELAGNVAAFLDIDAFDLFAIGPGLLGDKNFTQHRFGVGADFVIRAGQANAAAAVGIVGEVPRTASAGVNLGFDDADIAAKFGRGLAGFVCGIGDRAAWNGNAEFREQTFGLIFVDVHERKGPEDGCWPDHDGPALRED